MKSRMIAALAAVSIAVSLAACSSDSKDSQSGSGSGSGTTVAGSTGSATGGTNEPGLTLPPGVTFPNGTIPSNLPGLPSITLPPGLTIPPGGTFPPGITIPQSYIDAMIAQLEAAGMKVDHECFNNLMSDKDLQRTILNASTPSNEVIQKLVSCFRA